MHLFLNAYNIGFYITASSLYGIPYFNSCGVQDDVFLLPTTDLKLRPLLNLKSGYATENRLFQLLILV